jgi:hypothetical protein
VGNREYKLVRSERENARCEAFRSISKLVATAAAFSAVGKKANQNPNPFEFLKQQKKEARNCIVIITWSPH